MQFEFKASTIGLLLSAALMHQVPASAQQDPDQEWKSVIQQQLQERKQRDAALAAEQPARDDKESGSSEQTKMEPTEKLPFGYVHSINAFATPWCTEGGLDLAAEYANSMRQFSTGRQLIERALKKNDDDADFHKAYAEALEGELKQQTEPDPELFNKCIKEWIIVLRNYRGEEKGINGKNGLGLPGLNKLYEDEDRVMAAKDHLTALVGKAPRPGETDDKYFAHALKPASLSVSAKILSKPVAAPPTVLWMK